MMPGPEWVPPRDPARHQRAYEKAMRNIEEKVSRGELIPVDKKLLPPREHDCKGHACSVCKEDVKDETGEWTKHVVEYGVPGSCTCMRCAQEVPEENNR